MDEIRLIISDSLDRPLDRREAELLTDNLRDNSVGLDQFVLHNFIHSLLTDWMGQQRVQDAALSGGFNRNGVPLDLCRSDDISRAFEDVSHQPRPSVTRGSGKSFKRSWPRSAAVLAAMLLIATSVFTVGYLVATRPQYVGQLTEANGCRWAASQGTISVGTLLESNQELQLVTGRAVIMFASGAQILVEGPTTLRLDSAQQAHLLEGRIATKVPTHAIGFVVTSPLARFVDLGTAFTLMLDRDKTFELYVFEGLVEVQLDQRFGEAAGQPLRIAEVRAVKFDAKQGDVSTLPFNQGEQMPF